MDASHSYFANNVNICANGLSLLALNSMEIEGRVSAINAQTDISKKTVKNIAAHSKYMKKKTGQALDKLR